MNFDLVKKNSAYKRFLSDVKSGKLSHAYIVFSEDDELREAFYKLAAISVFCKNACGECKTCQSILNDDYVEILKVNAQDKFGVRDMEDLNEWGVAVVRSGVTVGEGASVAPKAMVDADVRKGDR